jgi:hypothetical protein
LYSFEEATEQDWETWMNKRYIPQTEKDHVMEFLRSKDFQVGSVIPDNLGLEKEILITCFSEVNYNILMWSHYANNHKGICLKFKTTQLGNTVGLLFDDKNLKFNNIGINGYLPFDQS